jgi:hypothetical protein
MLEVHLLRDGGSTTILRYYTLMSLYYCTSLLHPKGLEAAYGMSTNTFL